MTKLHLPTRGQLQLDFQLNATTGQTFLQSCHHQPPLKVVRAFEVKDGAALVHLHNLSGGVLGGDILELDVQVGPEAKVQITSTGATRLYRSLDMGKIASQTNKVRVAEGGLLEFLPDQLIPFAGSLYCQTTTIDLAENAGLFWWETLAPGRVAMGELFKYNFLQMSLEITADGYPILLERVKFEPAKRSLATPVHLGPYRYLSSFYICRIGRVAAYWRTLEQKLAELAEELSSPEEIVWGVSALAAHGLVVRGLSQNGRDLEKGLLAFWQMAKMDMYGQTAIPPRKVQ